MLTVNEKYQRTLRNKRIGERLRVAADLIEKLRAARPLGSGVFHDSDESVAAGVHELEIAAEHETFVRELLKALRPFLNAIRPELMPSNMNDNWIVRIEWMEGAA